jgi:hypothetical protein
MIGNKPFCVKSKNKFPPECSGTSRSFCLIFAGYQFWTAEKNLSFTVAGAFEAQKIPRSRIRRVLFLRQRIISLMLLFLYCARCRVSSNFHRTSQGLGLIRSRHLSRKCATIEIRSAPEAKETSWKTNSRASYPINLVRPCGSRLKKKKSPSASKKQRAVQKYIHFRSASLRGSASSSSDKAVYRDRGRTRRVDHILQGAQRGDPKPHTSPSERWCRPLLRRARRNLVRAVTQGPFYRWSARAAAKWLPTFKPEALASKVECLFDGRSWKIIWTPPYCPKFQSIELFFWGGRQAACGSTLSPPPYPQRVKGRPSHCILWW